MQLSRFILLVFVGAALVVGAAALIEHESDRPAVGVDHSPAEEPGHVFIAAGPGPAAIECPLTSLPEWNAIWWSQPPRCTLGGGWIQPSTWGSWMWGARSELLVDLDDGGAHDLVIDAKAHPDVAATRQQALTVRVGDVELGPFDIGPTWTQLRVEMPAAALRVGANRITLVPAAAIAPRDVGRGKDYRRFSIGVRKIGVRQAVGAEQSRAAHATPAQIWDEDRGVYAIERPGTLVVPLELPDQARTVDIELSGSRSVDPGAVHGTVSVEDLNRTVVRSRPIELPSNSSHSHIVLEVDDLAGRSVLLSVAAEIEAGRLEVSPPQVTTPSPDTAVRPEAGDAGVVADPPDLIVIILDAARADRFGFAGNRRDTSPNIDRLAATSLIFSRVFALAPYTLCSVPTMITGLSYLDHGVIDHSDVLSPDAVTLAEILRQHGYRTACFTSTPNNSRAKGFDQGYEVFREMWTEQPRRKARRAHVLAGAVAEWLDQVPDDGRPLHLQVHMVPPHAPYDPSDKFDLFTDPGYDGPCDGYFHTLAALDGGSMAPTEACVGHLLDLYDGNLRMADDATEQILNALRRRPRWHNTLVLITSDHGEAFLEHGRTDHNSTVYTEMLHVPFVLHLPADLDVGAVDTDGLATLADIVPTLLHAAGITPPDYPDAVDLLARTRDRESRFMVARTTGPTPTLGLRTSRWSLVLDVSGAGALFDLRSDPHERDNLVFSERERLAGLGLILTSRYERPPQLSLAAGSADITDEERALLETLGYLR